MLIDIMLRNRFVCQLDYDRRGRLEIIDGEAMEVYDPADIAQFVEERRPSLRGKPYNISFSAKPVY